MKKVAVWIAVVAASLVFSMVFAPMSFAQAGLSDEGNQARWSLGVPPTALQGFTGTEAIVEQSGTVKSIKKASGAKDTLQLNLKSNDGGMFTVFVGPKWFVENQKLKFAAGDKIDVRGKKYQSIIIATEISKGDWSMKLRDEEDGTPSWQCCFPRAMKEQ